MLKNNLMFEFQSAVCRVNAGIIISTSCEEDVGGLESWENFDWGKRISVA